MEQLNYTPELTLDTTEVEEVRNIYERQALICRFNGFWTKPMDLFHWIFTKWSLNCDVMLCSKGFFIVKLPSEEVRALVIQEGPWFWGSSGLFITPWTPEFDANSFIVTRMPVWVPLHNLPAHFWDQKTLACIGNSFDRYIKMDTQRVEDGIYTFARICVEVDVSKGLPNRIILKHKDRSWMQTIDYENTAFRCRICRQTGHLQNACLDLKKDSQRRRKSGKRKGWTFPPPDPEEEEEGEEELPIPNENSQVEPQEQSPQVPMEPQPEKAFDTIELSGTKRQHKSDTSDSDKENPQPSEENPLQLVPMHPAQGEWHKVEKKKGRKT